MSVYLHAENIFDTRNTFPWPNIPLLHLQLKGRAAILGQARGHHRLGSRIRARSGVQSPNEAVANRPARARSSQVKPAEDSKQALSAFLAGFRDTFKRKQSARCLKLVLDYAATLHGSPDREQPSGGWPSTPGSHESLSMQLSSSAELPTAAGGSGQPAYQPVPLTLPARRHLSSVLKGKHQALMGMLIADGNAAGAIQYLYLLPPDTQLCSCLMKECSAAGDLAGLQMVIQVCSLLKTCEQRHVTKSSSRTHTGVENMYMLMSAYALSGGPCGHLFGHLITFLQPIWSYYCASVAGKEGSGHKGRYLLLFCPGHCCRQSRQRAAAHRGIEDSAGSQCLQCGCLQCSDRGLWQGWCCTGELSR